MAQEEFPVSAFCELQEWQLGKTKGSFYQGIVPFGFELKSQFYPSGILREME
jgi:hypothetical protein